MLKSGKPEERFRAQPSAKGPLTGELIDLLTDKSDPVRQAAPQPALTSFHLTP